MKFFQKLKSFFYLTLTVSMIIFIIYFFMSFFNYIDVADFCSISIHGDLLRGNKQTVFKAIRLIKQEDKTSYKLLCKYVDTIQEDYCPVASPDFTSISYSNNNGCYIRGSKIVIIVPQSDESQEIIEQRMNLLKRYSSLSKKFWENYEED